MGVFIDLKKAFDTVDHQILLKKMEHYGIRCQTLKLLESYLSDRTQYVCYGGVESERGPVKCGVPQGSVLGPLFFLIYVNDIWGRAEPQEGLKIGNEQVRRVEGARFLGIWVDEKLKWTGLALVGGGCFGGLGLLGCVWLAQVAWACFGWSGLLR